MSEDKDKFSLDAPLDLDSTLDDIEDLPGFGTWPAGAYTITLAKGMEEKEINNKKAIEVAMTLDEVTEMTGQLELGEDAPKPGDICSTAYFLANKVALNNLKKEWLKPLSSLGNSVREIARNSKGVKCLVVMGRRYGKTPEGKTDTEKKYVSIKKVALL